MLKATSHRQAALLSSALVVCWLASGSDRDSSLTLTIDCAHFFLRSNFCELEINSQFAYSQLKPDLRYDKPICKAFFVSSVIVTVIVIVATSTFKDST